MAVISPNHQVALGGEGFECLAVPVAHHIVPEDWADVACVQIVKDRADVMQVKRALAVFFHVGFGFGVFPERPGFVATEVELFDVGHEFKHVVDHALDQLARFRIERVDAG